MKRLIFILIVLVLDVNCQNTTQATITTTKKCKEIACGFNQIFDFSLCKCICNPGIKCESPSYALNSTTCECECVNKQNTTCTKYQFFDDSKCKCGCRDDCLGCVAPQVYDSTNCYCKCAGNSSCPSYQYWDYQSCKCKCKDNQNGCCAPKIWDANKCNCYCPSIQTCSSTMKWDANQCKCVCKKKLGCKLPFVWRDDTCQCGCPDATCIENHIYNKTNCSCQCDNSLKSTCLAGVTTWSDVLCQCLCDNTDISCDYGFILDPVDCVSCIYPQHNPCPAPLVFDKNLGICGCSEILDCAIGGDNGIHYFDKSSCSCKCNVTADALNCPVNMSFDYASCQCLCTTETNCSAGLFFDPMSCQCTSTKSIYALN